MTREEKEEIIRQALAGNLEPLRQYRKELERPNGGAIWEGEPFNPKDTDRVIWYRIDGTPVVELATEYMKRENHGPGIHLPDNGRDNLLTS